MVMMMMTVYIMCWLTGSMILLLIAIIMVYFLRRIVGDNFDWEPPSSIDTGNRRRHRTTSLLVARYCSNWRHLEISYISIGVCCVLTLACRPRSHVTVTR